MLTGKTCQVSDSSFASLCRATHADVEPRTECWYNCHMYTTQVIPAPWMSDHANSPYNLQANCEYPVCPLSSSRSELLVLTMAGNRLKGLSTSNGHVSRFAMYQCMGCTVCKGVWSGHLQEGGKYRHFQIRSFLSLWRYAHHRCLLL